MHVYVTYVAREVVDGGLGKHGVVLELRLAKRRSVARDDDKLGLSRTDGLLQDVLETSARCLWRGIRTIVDL